MTKVKFKLPNGSPFLFRLTTCLSERNCWRLRCETEEFVGRPRIDGKLEAKIRGLLGSGKGICSTAVAAGVGVATVQRIKADMRA
jgi:hypothetical protein